MQKRKVNHKKVAWVVVQYRCIIALATLCNALFIFGIALFFFAAVELALLCSLIVAVAILGAVWVWTPTFDLSALPLGVKPITTPRYHWVVKLWRARCVAYGVTPGPVFMVKHREDDRMLWGFGMDNISLLRMHPVFTVSELALPLLRPEVVGPIIEHELGHCRLLTPLLRYFFRTVSIPGTYVLYLLSAIHRWFAQQSRFPAVVALILHVEHLFFWSSCYAIAQYDEYAADALMAEAVSDEEQVVSALTRLHKRLADLGGRRPSPENAHLVNHPALEQRIKAIRALFE